MWQLIKCDNPFDVSRDRTITSMAADDKTVADYLPQARADERLVVTVNGRILPESEYDYSPKVGDYVAVTRRPGDVVTGIVSWIADILVGVGVESWLATGLAWAGTLYVGGLLLQSLYEIPDLPSLDSDMGEQTYGWNSISSQEGQGGAISITYGTVRTAGQVLARHITTSGDSQYLNILLCGGEGPLSISDVQINGNDSTNYDDVDITTKSGTNTQTVISNFNDSYADQSLSYKLDGDYTSHTTSGDGGEGLEITIECPSGLYHVKDDGNLENKSVTVTAQYKLHADGTWTDWDVWTITGNSRTALRRTYRLDDLTAGQYDVRVKVSGLNSGSRYSTDTYWTLLSHIIYDDFVYPNMGLVGVKALATDQLNSSTPTITWTQTRSTIYAWNPTAAEYQAKNANNPAWAAYDALHGCRLLDVVGGGTQYVVRGVPATRMDYTAFAAWATWCDTTDLEINIAIDKADDLWTILNQKIAPVGRGCVVMRGTKYSCIYDCTGSPVQLFGEGNIIAGTFEEEFLPIEDRANAAEVTFKNADKDYETDTCFVMGDDYDAADIIKNPVQIHFDGITDYDQAYREAAYRLRLNKYLTRTVRFKADVDSIACQVGDVVSVAHSVPAWGTSGRAESGSTSTTIKLDQSVTLSVGTTYTITVRHSDDTLETRTVQAVGEETATDTLTVTSAWTATPAEFDVYAFGEEDVQTKPFRITRINRDGEMIREITALEYVADVYNEATSVTVPDYNAFGNTVTNLRGVTTWGPDGACYMGISWTPPRVDYGGAVVLVDGVQKASVNSATTSCVLSAIQNTAYVISVASVRQLGQELEPVTLNYTTDSQPDPDDVTNFGVLVYNGELVFSWSEVEQCVPVVRGYEIRRGDTWASAETVLKVAGKSTVTASTANILRGTHTYWIAAYNGLNNYSDAPTSTSIAITSIPEKDVVQTVTDAEESASVTGDATLEGGVLYQDGPLTYGDLAGYTYTDMSDLYPYRTASSGAVVTFEKIDIGKTCQYTVLVDTRWMITPDAQVSWEYRTSDDDITWSDWATLTLGAITSRYLQLRATLVGVEIASICEGVDIYVDVPEQTQKWKEQTIEIGGTTISFSPAFVDTPSILVTPLDDNRFVKLTAYDNESVTIQINNASETDVGGKASVEASGF